MRALYFSISIKSVVVFHQDMMHDDCVIKNLVELKVEIFHQNMMHDDCVIKNLVRLKVVICVSNQKIDS